METVEVVVKLPQNLYLDVKNGYASNIQREKVIERVKNGIVLPKGHGRLIDGDKLIRPEIQPFLYHLENGDTAIPEIDILHAPTIIGADKEADNERTEWKSLL